MINITDKYNCCGCAACVQSCPKQCISFDEDEQGFRYPLVNKDICIDCGICEKVCPMLHLSDKHEPIKVFAAKNPNEGIRMKSSSGGIFTMLAVSILDEEGVVFGARFDENWEVMHDYTDTKDGLKAFRGSKYIQSRIGDTYIQAREFLKVGRKVLFSGTPCQILGLKNFLGKEYVNLLTVECVCHSVPSPGIWRKYLQEFLQKQKMNNKNLKSISFRNKKTGWKGYSCFVEYKDGTQYLKNREEDLWMRGFLNGLFNRPSCANCPAKIYTTKADITIGDLWGITQLAPELDDDKGMCVVLCHTINGTNYIDTSKIIAEKEFSLFDVANKNLAITTNANNFQRRQIFYTKLSQQDKVMQIIDRMTKNPLKKRLRQTISDIVRTFFPRK